MSESLLAYVEVQNLRVQQAVLVWNGEVVLLKDMTLLNFWNY